MNNYKALLITALITLTTACGWQLRGQVNLPANMRILNLDVAAVDYTMQNALKQSLLSNGVTISADATYTLKLLKETASKRTLAVLSNAKASEFELIQSLSFVLLNNNGLAVTDEVEVSTYRTQQYDANAEIAKAQEEQNLRRDMKFANANKLLMRLKALQVRKPETAQGQ